MKKTLKTVFYTIIAVILGIVILFFVISAIAVGSTGEKFGTVFFIILAIIFSISFYGCINIIRGKENNTQNIFKPKKQLKQKDFSKKKFSDKPEKISKKPHKIKSVAEPIEGYTLKRCYKNVEISSWEHIPKDIEVGNRIVLIQEPTNEADSKAVMLMFVPQRQKLGYLYRGKLQDMANEYINSGDKVVARLSYLKFKPHKVVKINLAFFKKTNKKFPSIAGGEIHRKEIAKCLKYGKTATEHSEKNLTVELNIW